MSVRVRADMTLEEERRALQAVGLMIETECTFGQACFGNDADMARAKVLTHEMLQKAIREGVVS